MPCLPILLGLALPRVLLVYLWFFTEWFTGMFDSLLWPLLGFIFLPTTLLWYSAVHHWYGGHWGTWQIVGVIIALAIDTSPGHAGRARRRKAA